MTEAARKMPGRPYLKPPSLAGRNGVQLSTACAWWMKMNMAPTPTNSTSTPTLMKTITLLTLADSEMPTTSRAVTARMPRAPRMLAPPPATKLRPPSPWTAWMKEVVNSGGITMPKLPSSDTTLPDQPAATVEAATPYSSTSSQPMIQAKTSPRLV